MLTPNDPARQTIVTMAVAKSSEMLDESGVPTAASHSLGEVTLEDGRKVTAHVVHAVDPVITDSSSVVIDFSRFKIDTNH